MIESGAPQMRGAYCGMLGTELVVIVDDDKSPEHWHPLAMGITNVEWVFNGSV